MNFDMNNKILTLTEKLLIKQKKPLKKMKYFI